MENYSKKINKNTILFSNDPGGAQVLSSYFYYKNNKNIYLCSSRSTEKFFKEKKIKFKKISFKKALKIGSKFYTSTSWKSNIEVKAIKELVSRKKKVITFLDGWDNYKARFKYNKKYYFPNEIWTFDDLANKYCKKIFSKKIKIINKKNFFIKYALKQISRIKKSKNYKKNCLFLTEPITETYQKMYKKLPPYSELKAFSLFLKKIGKIKQIENINIKIHPNDKIKNYKKIAKKFNNLKIKFTNKNIFTLLKENYYVASCASSVMYLAEKNKNKVICCIPKKNIKPKLPLKRFNYLHNF